MSNGLAEEIRALQCQIRETAHKNAVATAQYNGWLAASYLSLPTCTKLQPTGRDVAVLQCTPRVVTFSTIITDCGPQPKVGNFTISVEGWELSEYRDCYWHTDFVNFNGRAHSYKNGTWEPIVPSVAIKGTKLINALSYEVDNTLGAVLQLHPALKQNPLSPAEAMADILATVHEHSTNDIRLTRRVSNVLLNAYDAPHISFMARVGSWIRTFGSLSGIGIILALGFRFCGLGSIIARFIPCLPWLSTCNPFSWLAAKREADVETGGHSGGSTPSVPINIINVPPVVQQSTNPEIPRTMTVNNRTPRDEKAATSHRQAALLLQR
ncbi:hypothetical protein GHT06_020252 [Daphnia sinensis]|uniref:Uncharacterized protein n=1 Tax=Daphnia sinensis TaxID=1820382 RepID=A0AAD5KL66_9CRUS|nr:hypothetical protein GHT06_020252 [Daphnia sinensis]